MTEWLISYAHHTGKIKKCGTAYFSCWVIQLCWNSAHRCAGPNLQCLPCQRRVTLVEIWVQYVMSENQWRINEWWKYIFQNFLCPCPCVAITIFRQLHVPRTVLSCGSHQSHGCASQSFHSAAPTINCFPLFVHPVIPNHGSKSISKPICFNLLSITHIAANRMYVVRLYLNDYGVLLTYFLTYLTKYYFH